MGQYSKPKKEIASSTLLATPKKKREYSGEETVLVTETFHLTPTKEGVLPRTKILIRSKKVYSMIAGIGMLILLCIVFFSLRSENSDISGHSEKDSHAGLQITSQANEVNDVSQGVAEKDEVRKIPVENHTESKPVAKVTTAPVSDKTKNKDIAGLSLPATSSAKPEVEEINKVSSRYTQTLPQAKSTAFSNVFSYGMQKNNRLTSPGTAEANLRSSRSRNNTSFSYRASGVDRTRRRSSDVLRFKIKDSGTRSVK